MKLQGSPATVKSRSPVTKKVPVVNITLPLSTVTAAVSQACADQKQDVELPISLTTHIIEQVKKATSKSTSFTHASSTTKRSSCCTNLDMDTKLLALCFLSIKMLLFVTRYTTKFIDSCLVWDYYLWRRIVFEHSKRNIW